jgi:hypothetical protein
MEDVVCVATHRLKGTDHVLVTSYCNSHTFLHVPLLLEDFGKLTTKDGLT